MARGEPLWPHGFDPMNVQVLDNKEVLHTRWIQPGNEGSSLEVLDRWSLTKAAGNYPLFGGIRSITVRGLPEKPLFTMVGGGLKVEADGFTGNFLMLKWIPQTMVYSLACSEELGPEVGVLPKEKTMGASAPELLLAIHPKPCPN